MRLPLAASLVLLPASLAACTQQSTTPAADETAFILPADNVMHGVTHRLTQDGIRRATLSSDSAYTYEHERRFDLMGVRVTFYNDTGALAGTVTSRSGEYDQESGVFVARDSVVLVSETPEGGERRLTTDELYYDVRSDELWSDHAFVLVENGRTSRGTSFRSDSKLETWSVTGAQTSGTVDDAEGGITF